MAENIKFEKENLQKTANVTVKEQHVIILDGHIYHVSFSSIILNKQTIERELNVLKMWFECNYH